MLSNLLAGLRELRDRPQHQIAGLDMLRAFAVLLVIFDHFRATSWLSSGGQDAVWLAQAPFTRYGWTGVDLFFVLSGFLIGQQLWRERFLTGGLNVRRFLIRRGLRIWPLYFVTLAALLVGLGNYQPEWSDWLLVSNYFPTAYARSWSLSTEEHFYLAAPALLLLTRQWSPRRYWMLLGAALIATVWGRLATAATLTARGVDARTIDNAMYAPFHLHNEGLLIGLMIALLATLHPGVVARSATAGWSIFGTAASAGMAVLGLLLHQVSQLHFAYLALGLIFGGALLFVLTNQSRLARFTGLWLWYPIARLSFGMYLNHVAFGRLPTIATMEWARSAGAAEWAVYLTGLSTTLLISLGLSIVTFLLVERPFLSLRDRWLAHESSSPAITRSAPIGAA